MGVLVSGPAGGGKSEPLRRILREATEPTIQADYQSLVVALLALERGPDGKYETRPSWILPLAEYTRQAVISGARGREISIVASNSDGSPERRRALLDRLGPGSVERVVDPGRDVVVARLADPVTGLSDECAGAIQRWYSRK